MKFIFGLCILAFSLAASSASYNDEQEVSEKGWTIPRSLRGAVVGLAMLAIMQGWVAPNSNHTDGGNLFKTGLTQYVGARDVGGFGSNGVGLDNALFTAAAQGKFGSAFDSPYSSSVEHVYVPGGRYSPPSENSFVQMPSLPEDVPVAVPKVSSVATPAAVPKAGWTLRKSYFYVTPKPKDWNDLPVDAEAFDYVTRLPVGDFASKKGTLGTALVQQEGWVLWIDGDSRKMDTEEVKAWYEKGCLRRGINQDWECAMVW